MNYEEIRNAAHAEGIMPYDQAAEADAEQLDIKRGICRALSILWLKAKKEGADFWKQKGTEREPLTAGLRRIAESMDVQNEYASGLKSRYSIDRGTEYNLKNAGITERKEDHWFSSTTGFANPHEAGVIAEKILSNKSRYYILSMKGDGGAHSIALHRPYAIIGKSSDCYVFDPNIGEYKVNGPTRLAHLLMQIHARGYGRVGMDLNKEYNLWAFYN